MAYGSDTSGIRLTLSGKVALVTGGSRGIGAATVRLLRQAGARVVFSYKNAEDRAQALVSECGGENVCRAVQQDLATAADGRSLVAKAGEVFGGLDIAVVNHGIWPPHDQPVDTMGDAQWRETLAVNLDSVFGIVSAAAALMKAEGVPIAEVSQTIAEMGPERAEAEGQDATAMTGDALYGPGSASGETRAEGEANARELLEEVVYSDRIVWPSPEQGISAQVARQGATPDRVYADGGSGLQKSGVDEGPFAGVSRGVRGHIVLVASTAAQRGEAFHADYAASKGALLSLTKSLSSELGPQGILCNCVAPGWVRTEMSAGTLSDPDASKKALGLVPLGRAAEPEEIAGPIVFLCTPWAGFISGEIWNVNGGAVLVG